jgi:REP element-mobilizing transposase RayT
VSEWGQTWNSAILAFTNNPGYEEEAYFNRLLRYIHLNPVRANIVEAPEKYQWSSHNAF